MMPELQKKARPRSWGRIAFLLSLPTLAGWLLSLLFWVSMIQSALLVAGSLLGVAGLPISLYACFRQDGKKRLALLALLLNAVSVADLCAMITVLAADLRFGSDAMHPSVTISKETTYFTEPLRADGFPDYVTAMNDLYGNGTTRDNNAAVLTRQAIGPKGIEEKCRAEYFRLLGIAALPDNGEYFIRWDDYLKEQLAKEDNEANTKSGGTVFLQSRDLREKQLAGQMRSAGIAPWSATSFPVVADWLKKNEQPFALLVAASNRPRFYCPIVPHGEPPMIASMNLADFDFRSAAEALCIRAMLRLNDGAIGAAREDLMACRRLARLLAQHPSGYTWVPAVGMERSAATGLLALFHYGPKNVKEANELNRQIQQLSDLPNPLESLELESRCMYLDSLGMVIRDTEHTRNRLDRLVGRAIVDPVLTDWNAACRAGNAFYDRQAQSARKSEWNSRTAAVSVIEEQLQAMGKRTVNIRWLPWQFLISPRGAWGRVFGEKVLAMTGRANKHLLEMWDDTITRAQLLRVASTINVYRAEHGTYPNELTDLIPKYLATMPVDIFHENRLHYRTEDDGYVLFSLGANGANDGGLDWREADSFDAFRHYDIAVTVPPKSSR